MKSQILKTTAMLLACHVLAGHASAVTPYKDTFKTDRLKSSKWTLKNSGKAKMIQKDGRLHFTVINPPGVENSAYVEFRRQPSHNEDWEITVDAFNSKDIGYLASGSISISSAEDPTDMVFLEYYGYLRGLNVFGMTDDYDNPAGDFRYGHNILYYEYSDKLRITFDHKTKYLTFWTNRITYSDPFKNVIVKKKINEWEKICSYSISGKGGDRRGKWTMSSKKGRFVIRLGGYTEKKAKAIQAGVISFDNFELKPWKRKPGE